MYGELVRVLEPTSAQEIAANYRAVKAKIYAVDQSAVWAAKVEERRRFAAIANGYALSTDRGRLRYIEPIGPKVSIENFRIFATRLFGVSAMETRARRHNIICAMTRHSIAWLARCCTPMSLPEIGRALGGRDHTTVRNSVILIDLMIREAGIVDTPSRAIRQLSEMSAGELSALRKRAIKSEKERID